MKRRYNRLHRNYKIKHAINEHFERNIKEYFIACLIFFIGILIGIMVINRMPGIQKDEIIKYISSFFTNIKETSYINDKAFLINSIKKNAFYAFALWLISSTVIGFFIVYIAIGFSGFCLGYTISSLILCMR